jgi:Na+/proline symporter/signal transduction histidine kinase/ActR/RegA family two-component response regulator
MGFVDIGIVVCFLILTLGVGLYYGKGVNNIRDYALGGRNFSTATLAATIIATWTSSSSFIIAMTKAYEDGSLHFLAASGGVIHLFLIGYVIAPRMKEFLGKISAAEVMGDIYGDLVQVISAIVGIFVSVGLVTLQFKVLSSSLSFLSGIDIKYSLIVCSTIAISYSMFGGVRAVTFTDVLQFIAFIIVIPSILISMIVNTGIVNDFERQKIALNHLMEFSSNSGMHYPTLFIYFLIPGLNPAMFQRLLIGKTTNQIVNAFGIASIVHLLILFMSASIGILLFIYSPNLDTSSLLGVLIENFCDSGLKGLLMAAIIAMAMSTLDSSLNAAAVTFSYDILRKIYLLSPKNEVFVSKIFVFIIGVISTIATLFFQDILKMIVFAYNFYMPVVTVPLILAILGFRSTTRPVLIGMAAGFSTVVFWKMTLQGSTGFDSLIPGMIANLVFFVGSHYLLGSSGGWNKPDDRATLKEIQDNRQKTLAKIKDYFSSLFCSILTLNPTRYGIKIDNSSSSYLMLGILIICSYTTIAVSSEPIVTGKYPMIMQFISLGIAGALITYSLWCGYLSDSSKDSFGFVSILFLLFSSFFMMLTHGFTTPSVVTFGVNIIVSAMLIPVIELLGMVVFSVVFAGFYYSSTYGTLVFSPDYSSTLVLIYLFFAISVIIFTFLKGKENHITSLESDQKRLSHLNQTLNAQIELREEDLQKALDMQGEILRNVNHEIKTPMSTLISNADLLAETWNNPKFESNMKDIVDGIVVSVKRFSSYASNLVDLSQFSRDQMSFDIKKHNLKGFIDSVLLGYEDVDLDYSLKLPEQVEIDEIKIKSCIRNLLDNAIKFSDEMKVKLIIQASTEKISFDNKSYESFEIIVSDLGVGIPENELEKIFEPFYISSRTKQISGGKGLGLALCKEIVAHHVGRIYATNNQKNGVSIKVILPIEHPKSRFLVGNGKNITHSQEKLIDLKSLLSKTIALENQFKGRIPKILMVDDESLVLKSGEMLIKALGYDFKGIDNGEEAIEYINSDTFDADLVLLDMMLRDMSGVDVMKGIKEKRDNKVIKVIIQSGLTEGDPNIMHALGLGAIDFLGKPYNKNSLDYTIRKALGIEWP